MAKQVVEEELEITKQTLESETESKANLQKDIASKDSKLKQATSELKSL